MSLDPHYGKFVLQAECGSFYRGRVCINLKKGQKPYDLLTEELSEAFVCDTEEEAKRRGGGSYKVVSVFSLPNWQEAAGV